MTGSLQLRAATVPELPGAACRDPAAAALFAKNLAHIGNRVAAKAVCNRCRARPECLAWALEHETTGIWGGAAPKELNEIRREFGITLEELWALTPTKACES